MPRALDAPISMRLSHPIRPLSCSHVSSSTVGSEKIAQPMTAATGSGMPCSFSVLQRMKFTASTGDEHAFPPPKPAESGVFPLDEAHAPRVARFPGGRPG